MAASARDRDDMQQQSPGASAPSIPDTHCDGFQSFSNLPAELRLIIWNLAIDESLLVVCGSSHSSDCIPTMAQTTTALGRVTCWHERRSVSLLNTCRESRAAVCAGYLFWSTNFEPAEATQPYWRPLRPEIDTILCADDSFLRTVLARGFGHLAFKTPEINAHDIIETTGSAWKSHWLAAICLQYRDIRDMIENLGYNVAALGSCTMVVTEAMRHHPPSLGDGPFPFTDALYPLEELHGNSAFLHFVVWTYHTRENSKRLVADDARVFVVYRKANQSEGRRDFSRADPRFDYLPVYSDDS